jgi:hypothetical protein
MLLPAQRSHHDAELNTTSAVRYYRAHETLQTVQLRGSLTIDRTRGPIARQVIREQI